mmetsp:Transcript_2142/g.6772  ORF Transcript_2142/g.6772 Transcript_2142/m.6772 type:complete len:218 (-) Transcript_2142:2894-3547(-)
MSAPSTGTTLPTETGATVVGARLATARELVTRPSRMPALAVTVLPPPPPPPPARSRIRAVVRAAPVAAATAAAVWVHRAVRPVTPSPKSPAAVVKSSSEVSGNAGTTAAPPRAASIRRSRCGIGRGMITDMIGIAAINENGGIETTPMWHPPPQWPSRRCWAAATHASASRHASRLKPRRRPIPDAASQRPPCTAIWWAPWVSARRRCVWRRESTPA